MSKYGKRAVGLLLTGALCAGLLAGCGGAPEAAVTPTAPSESGSASGRRVETLRLEWGTDWGVPNPYLHQLAWEYGRLLSYPDEAIRRLISDNPEKERL